MGREGRRANIIPDPETNEPARKPTMLTTDLALRVDPIYDEIGRRFLENPDQFADAFARAWYKLLHRDMGPVSRYLGPWVPEPQLWQDPVPPVDHELIGDADIAALKATILDSGLTIPQLVSTAWASAASFRSTDYRGGANGARIRLEPQRNWAVNEPEQLARVLRDPRGDPAGVQRLAVRPEGLAGRPDRPGRLRGRREGGAERRPRRSPCRSRPGRTDASQEQTDVETFAVLEPTADGFRNYSRPGEKLPLEVRLARPRLHAVAHRSGGGGAGRRPAGPGGQRRGDPARRLHRPAGHADQRLLREPARHLHGVEAVARRRTCTRAGTAPRATLKWTATAVDLVFGSHSQLRAISEVYAQSDAQEKFVRDFVAAWDRVMNLDRFDLR